MRIKVDRSAETALGLCGCGERLLARSHLAALQALAGHEMKVHPGEKHAREALRSYTKRHADLL